MPAPVLPAPLSPGARVAVVATSSPFEAVLGWRALGFLAERYRLVFRRRIFERTGYLVGPAEARRAELQAALDRDDVAAIVCARGGYGASQFAHRLDWAALARAPKWIVGFSDVTVLHCEAARAGVASLHAPNLTSLGRGDARGRAEWIEALEAPDRPRSWELAPIAPGAASGHLRGGNLTLLHACAAAGRLSLPRPTILFVEDVTERPYRLDRVLTTLREGGHLDGVVGVVLGEFTQCEPGPDGVRVEDVVAATLGPLGVPIAAGAPAGHGRVNRPIVLGAPARLSVGATSGALALFPPQFSE